MVELGKIVTHAELLTTSIGQMNEPMVSVRKYDRAIIAQYEKDDMLPYTGKTIYVRDTVARKLARINRRLIEKGLCLRVVYGFRHVEVQRKYFAERRAILTLQYPALSGPELDTLTHNFVAMPEVAGHPTGGAVDVTIVEDNESETPLDMGTGIADYSNPELVKTFGQGISETVQQNRWFLLNTMTGEGFAAFFGEWWHFSFGDREWSFYYDRPTRYPPIDFRSYE